jgi:hypothetical protein
LICTPAVIGPKELSGAAAGLASFAGPGRRLGAWHNGLGRTNPSGRRGQQRQPFTLVCEVDLINLQFPGEDPSQPACAAGRSDEAAANGAVSAAQCSDALAATSSHRHPQRFRRFCELLSETPDPPPKLAGVPSSLSVRRWRRHGRSSSGIASFQSLRWVASPQHRMSIRC